jgi:hypothetical protein
MPNLPSNDEITLFDGNYQYKLEEKDPAVVQQLSHVGTRLTHYSPILQVSHMFGDAFSPYLIGALADTFKPHIHLHQTPTALQLQVTSGTRVADPGCLSRIPVPDFLPIPDPKTSTKERGEKKFVLIPFYVARNFTKFKILLFLKS